jgi:hypothetical protein
VAFKYVTETNYGKEEYVITPTAVLEGIDEEKTTPVEDTFPEKQV